MYRTAMRHHKAYIMVRLVGYADQYVTECTYPPFIYARADTHARTHAHTHTHARPRTHTRTRTHARTRIQIVFSLKKLNRTTCTGTVIVCRIDCRHPATLRYFSKLNTCTTIYQEVRVLSAPPYPWFPRDCYGYCNECICVWWYNNR